MIAKVIRGTDARRLLYYLYGPGRANEHTDPHLVAGFGDPAELEPARRPDGSPDLRRLAGLLAQPVAALCGPGYDNPVWHCSIRAAPGDRILTDAEWADVAAEIMHTTGLATRGDEAGVRWAAVRHADDHIHIVATLARQDGTKPRTWNDFYRVREACRNAEERLELRATPPADRTGGRRPSRAETEQAARRGWGEPPRVTLRRHVCTAAAGTRSEREFFGQLTAAGVLVRKRYSTEHPGQVTGYAVGLPHHRSRDGGVIWYGGGKLAADLSLPKLRARWRGGTDQLLGSGLSPPAARAVLRNVVTSVAGQAGGEQEFFDGLRTAGVEVRLRFSEITLGQVTGYSVTLPGHTGPYGTPAWYGGGRLFAALTLPQLRRQWRLHSRDGSEQRDAHMPGSGAETPFPTAFRFTVGERDMIYKHAAHQAARATEHVRSCARSDPGQAADAAWATADTLHTAAWVTKNRALRCAADAYDRAARAPFGRIPHRTPAGNGLRIVARTLALMGPADGDAPMAAMVLIGNLVALTVAVAELREAQHQAARAAAARVAAEHLHAASAQLRAQAPRFGRADAQRRARMWSPADLARHQAARPPLAPHAEPVWSRPTNIGSESLARRRTTSPSIRAGPRR